MNYSYKYLEIILPVLITMTLSLSSCNEDKEPVVDLQIKDMPSMSSHDTEIMYSDSGKVTLVMRAPLINRYENVDNAYTEFPEGVNVLFYDKQETPQASINCRFARYTDKDELWELRDSVVVVDEKGGILETELLYWSEDKERVWSDRFVQYTDKEQIVRGTGFESDQRLVKWKIKNVSATIYMEEQRSNPERLEHE